MTPNPSDLMSVVLAALDERGWQHAVRAEVWRTARVQGPHTAYELLFRADDGRGLLVAYCVFPMLAPPELHPALAETVARANCGLPIGNFELDHADGELRFKVSVDVEGGELVPLMVHNMIGAALATCDQYYPAIARVLYAGARPEAAIAEVEAASDAADAANATAGADDDAVSPEVDAFLRSLGVPPGDADEGPRADDAPEPEGGRAGDAALLAAPIANCYVVGDARLLAGEYPGDRVASAAREKLSRLLDAGVTCFLDLTAEQELRPYAPLLAELAGGRTVKHLRLPIRDMGVPTPARMAEILDAIDAALDDGHTVYVHCWGGVGRTGTTVACHLVRRGHDADGALAEVARLFATMSDRKRRHHPEGSPQTPEQRAFVRAWEAEERARRMGTRPAERRRVEVRPAARRGREHFRGCLLGGAVGDALGAPVEFMRLAEIREHYGPAGIVDLDVAYGRVGAITDDTQLTMFTAEGLLRAKSCAMTRALCDVPAIVRHAYLRWLRTQDANSPEPPHFREAPGWLVRLRALHARRAPGNSCLSALYDPSTGTPDAPLNDSKGCGGVMRVAPVALLTPGDAFTDALVIAALTHGHPTGHLAAGAFAEMLHHVLEGAPLEQAVHAALARLAGRRAHEETTTALTAALDAWREGGAPTAERVRRLGRGWVAEEALAIATYCALAAGDDYAAGVRLAVNHSGDSDSTGAIAGNLLGARLGASAIPPRWLARLELRRELETLADDLLTGWRDGAEWAARYPPM